MPSESMVLSEVKTKTDSHSEECKKNLRFDKKEQQGGVEASAKGQKNM